MRFLELNGSKCLKIKIHLSVLFLYFIIVSIFVSGDSLSQEILSAKDMALICFYKDEVGGVVQCSIRDNEVIIKGASVNRGNCDGSDAEALSQNLGVITGGGLKIPNIYNKILRYGDVVTIPESICYGKQVIEVSISFSAGQKTGTYTFAKEHLSLNSFR